MGVLEREFVVVIGAHLLAVIPIVGLMFAARVSPLYELPSQTLARWWAWFALVIVVTAMLGTALTG